MTPAIKPRWQTLAITAVVVFLGVVAGFLLLRSTTPKASADSLVTGYLLDLKYGNCKGAVSKLMRSAVEQISLAYRDPTQLCKRLEEARRIPKSAKVVSVTEQATGETEVVVEVSYPEEVLTETYYVTEEDGALRIQPPWA